MSIDPETGTPMTPPDSGEREVKRCARCGRPWRGPNACLVQSDDDCRRHSVAMPLSLAQRILAALERTMTGDSRDDRRALADELRKEMGK